MKGSLGRKEHYANSFKKEMTPLTITIVLLINKDIEKGVMKGGKMIQN